MRQCEMREYIENENLRIDGRNIPYPIVTATDYFVYHDKVDNVDEIIDNQPEVAELITQILGLKQSCFLLRHTTHSCQSLPDGLYNLKIRLINELKAKHGYIFDDAWMESLVD